MTQSEALELVREARLLDRIAAGLARFVQDEPHNMTWRVMVKACTERSSWLVLYVRASLDNDMIQSLELFDLDAPPVLPAPPPAPPVVEAPPSRLVH